MEGWAAGTSCYHLSPRSILRPMADVPLPIYNQQLLWARKSRRKQR